MEDWGYYMDDDWKRVLLGEEPLVDAIQAAVHFLFSINANAK